MVSYFQRDTFMSFEDELKQIRLDGDFVVDRYDALGQTFKRFDRRCHFTML